MQEMFDGKQYMVLGYVDLFGWAGLCLGGEVQRLKQASEERMQELKLGYVTVRRGAASAVSCSGPHSVQNRSGFPFSWLHVWLCCLVILPCCCLPLWCVVCLLLLLVLMLVMHATMLLQLLLLGPLHPCPLSWSSRSPPCCPTSSLCQGMPRPLHGRQQLVSVADISVGRQLDLAVSLFSA